MNKDYLKNEGNALKVQKHQLNQSENKLAEIDKGRLKGVLQSQHAQHYPVWELLSMTRLSNGMNALDFFHTNNMISQQLSENAKRAKYQGGGLENAKIPTNEIVGGDFTDPSSAVPDQKNPGF